MSELREAIRNRALALGFDAVGFASATLAEEARAGLAAYLAKGHHGDMGWLAEKADRRGDPQTLWPDAKSVIVLGLNYGPEGDALALLAQGDRADISVYARNRDYHDTIKKRLKALARWLAEQYATEAKVFVDTAPVMEKPLAANAGIGWQGKHTNLVSRQFGSWLFLGEVFTALEIPADEPEIDHCGTCRNCLDACPTKAFPAPYQLDARRCISYLTIEHKGPIPHELRPLIGNRIYGCDDCLAVCPWNKFARAGHEADFRPRPELEGPRLADLATLDDTGFRRLFIASPVKRIGRDRFIRNVLIAIGNSNDPSLVAAARGLVGDPAPLVRGAAVWALSRLLSRSELSEIQAASDEAEPMVQAEWHLALAD